MNCEYKKLKMIIKNYCDGLSPELKEQYLKKLIHLSNINPYEKIYKNLDKNLKLLPLITHDMMMDFLLFRVNPETQQEVRAFKSLQAWVQFVCKWIQDIGFFQVANYFVVLGKVLHSQKVNDPPLYPWISLTKNSEIVETHCNCVAGFSGVCTHVASILFALQYASKNMESNQTVIDVLAYWIGPAKKRGDFSKTLNNINFDTPKKLLECENLKKTCKEDDSGLEEIPSLSFEETIDFLQNCKNQNQQVALLNVVVLPNVNDSNVNDCTNPLAVLYKPEYEKFSLNDLIKIAANFEIVMSQKECDEIQQKTKNQSKSKLWFYHRKGRITASIFKAICRTNIDNPSITLLRTICYPAMYKTLFKATEYGCKHEKLALKSYIEKHRLQHPTAYLKESGLIINPTYPFFGATPDSILVCSECKETCVEIKCPFCAKDMTIKDWSEFKKTCIISVENKMQLDPNHSYYYQCQMQMTLSRMDNCDFVVWTQNDLFVQRIYRNPEFWTEQSERALLFMKNVILPELLGKYFTNKAAKKTGAKRKTTAITT